MYHKLLQRAALKAGAVQADKEVRIPPHLQHVHALHRVVPCRRRCYARWRHRGVHNRVYVHQLIRHAVITAIRGLYRHVGIAQYLTADIWLLLLQ